MLCDIGSPKGHLLGWPWGDSQGPRPRTLSGFPVSFRTLGAGRPGPLASLLCLPRSGPCGLPRPAGGPAFSSGSRESGAEVPESTDAGPGPLQGWLLLQVSRRQRGHGVWAGWTRAQLCQRDRNSVTTSVGPALCPCPRGTGEPASCWISKLNKQAERQCGWGQAGLGQSLWQEPETLELEVGGGTWKPLGSLDVVL